jgi:hypothetical protein
MRYQPAHAAKSGSVPFTLRGPKSVRTVLSAAVAGAIAFAPAVLITSPAQAAITGFTIVDASVSAEEGEEITFEVKRTADVSALDATDIAWTLTGGTNPGEATEDVDYTKASGTLKFPEDASADLAGEYGGDSLFITVDTVDDESDEVSESFTLNLTAPGGTDTATGTITDDDAPPGYTLIVSDPSPAEDLAAGEVTVTAELDVASGKVVNIPIKTAAGTAKAGQDYTTTSDTITIPAGVTTTADKVTIAIEDDDLYEEAQQTFEVKADTSTTVTGTETETVTIMDDEEQPEITIDGVTVGEPGTLEFPVTLSDPSERAVTATWSTGDGPGADEPEWEDGIAKAGTDYTAGTGTVTFPAATSNVPAAGSTSQKITVRTVSDTIAEEREGMHVTLTSPTIAVLGDDAEATGAITDTDLDPTATLSPTAAITEGDGGKVTKTYTVKLNKESGREVEIDYTVAALTADDVADVFEKTGTLTFAPGETSKTFTVDVVGDTMHEGNETFTIALTGSGATVPGLATITITDDDDEPTVTVAPVTMTEGDTGSVAVFPIKLSNASSVATTFDILSVTGTATDDVAGAPGEFDIIEPTEDITIPAGQTTGYLFFLVNGDEVYETDETVSVKLDPTTANLDDDITTIDADLTIRNDDDMPSFEVTSVTGAEGETVDVMGVVTGVAEASTTFNINFAGASVNGSAAASTDDFTNPGTVAVPIAGGTMSGTPKLIKSVKLTDDTTPEGPETILASGNAVNGTVVNGVVTIATSDGYTPPPTGPSSLTLTGPASRVGPGPIRLSGKTDPSTAIQLWSAPYNGGDDDWSADGAASMSNASGLFTFDRTLTAAGRKYVVHAGATVSKEVKVGLRQAPAVSVTSPSKGVAYVKVTNGIPFAPFKIERRNTNGTWTTVFSGKLLSNGAYNRKVTAQTSGRTIAYRTYVWGSSTDGVSGATSPARSVRIR